MITPEPERVRIHSVDRSFPQGYVGESYAFSSADALATLEKSTLIMDLWLSAESEHEWSDQAYWESVLPAWFVDYFPPPLSAEDDRVWTAQWRAADGPGKLRLQESRGLAFPNWLASMSVERRPWRWWASEVMTPTTGKVDVLVDGWPSTLTGLEWLLKACGAHKAPTISGEM